MALRLLGEAPIDIHTGGIDLVFPHHENEIAQSEGATGLAVLALLGAHRAPAGGRPEDVEVARQLLHAERHHRARDSASRRSATCCCRRTIASSSISRGLGMQQAEEALRRLTDCLDRLDAVQGGVAHPEIVRAASDRARAAFDEALSDDLNTSAGLAAMFDLVRTVNTAIDQTADRRGRTSPTVRKAFAHFDKVLGVLALRRDEDRRPPMPEEEIQARDRRPPGRPRGPQLRGGRPHPRRHGRARRDLRGRPAGHPLEAEVAVKGTRRQGARRRTKTSAVSVSLVPSSCLRAFVIFVPPADNGGWTHRS